ncbi:hypothetical protein LCGC14_2010910 [marine sediment metagenome]|uniref:Uncharacterized protein n=1 Tax=marine sediment metagenome TaxID=412755 RepID=A0A0F9HXM6_9ZZZZ
MKKNKEVVRDFKRNVKKVREVPNSLTGEDILCIVAADPNTSGEFLDALSKNSNVDIRAIVANNRYVLTEVLDHLSKDKDVKVRCCVATNPNTSVKALERLSKDKERDVKFGVAYNPSVSRNCLMLLSKQKDTSILIAVVSNSECLRDILRTIFGQSLRGIYDVHDTVRIQSAIAFKRRISTVYQVLAACKYIPHLRLFSPRKVVFDFVSGCVCLLRLTICSIRSIPRLKLHSPLVLRGRYAYKFIVFPAKSVRLRILMARSGFFSAIIRQP